MSRSGEFAQKAARWSALAEVAQGEDRVRNARIAAAYRVLAELLAAQNYPLGLTVRPLSPGAGEQEITPPRS